MVYNDTGVLSNTQKWFAPYGRVNYGECASPLQFLLKLLNFHKTCSVLGGVE
jgi:hypothetical protein